MTPGFNRSDKGASLRTVPTSYTATIISTASPPTHVLRYDLSRSQWSNESHVQALFCDRRVPNLERRRLAVVAKDVQGRGIEQEVLAVTSR